MKVIAIAALTHAMCAAYMRSIGEDKGNVAWEDVPQAERQSFIANVELHLVNPNLTQEERHNNWLAAKEKDGWVYGEIKDAEKKTHPFIKPYAELSQVNRTTDVLFAEMVKLAKNLPDNDTFLQLSADYTALKAENETLRKGLENSQPVIEGSKATIVGTTIRYDGEKNPFVDHLYKTSLTFVHGQIRTLPSDIAEKFLQHPEFVLCKLGESTQDIDTETILESVDTLKQQREEQQRRVMDELDTINTMDKSGLVEYAYANYEQKLSMKQTLPDLRKSVIELVHQFGAVGI